MARRPPGGRQTKTEAAKPDSTSTLQKIEKIQRIQFDENQLLELRELGCTDAQVAMLEAACDDWRGLSQQPSAKEVKALLRDVEGRAGSLVGHLEGLLDPPSGEAAMRPFDVAARCLLASMGDLRGEKIGELMALHNALRRLASHAGAAQAQVGQPRGLQAGSIVFSLVAQCLSAEQVADAWIGVLTG